MDCARARGDRHARRADLVRQPLRAHAPPRKTTELNIEIVRPPKPPEPAKAGASEATAAGSAPPKQARVLPQIQQSEPLPQSEGESGEPPVAVAPGDFRAAGTATAAASARSR